MALGVGLAALGVGLAAWALRWACPSRLGRLIGITCTCTTAREVRGLARTRLTVGPEYRRS